MQPIAWKRVISNVNEKDDKESEVKKETQDFDEEEEGVSPFNPEGKAYVDGLE